MFSLCQFNVFWYLELLLCLCVPLLLAFLFEIKIQIPLCIGFYMLPSFFAGYNIFFISLKSSFATCDLFLVSCCLYCVALQSWVALLNLSFACLINLWICNPIQCWGTSKYFLSHPFNPLFEVYMSFSGSMWLLLILPYIGRNYALEDDCVFSPPCTVLGYVLQKKMGVGILDYVFLGVLSCCPPYIEMFLDCLQTCILNIL